MNRTGLHVLGASTIAPTLTSKISEMPRSAMKKYATAVIASEAVATVGLACLWKSHRILGGLLGFFLVGPALGTAIGSALVVGEIKP